MTETLGTIPLQFVRLLKVVPTTGSGPLHCVLSDGGSYYCKKSNFLAGCRYDLVNEVLANLVLANWGLFVPKIDFVKIDFDKIKEALVHEYLRINKPGALVQIQNPFSPRVFDSPFFASKEFNLHLHLDKYTSLDNLLEFDVKRLNDFLFILLFDLWFHNVDRKGSNSNTLVASDEHGNIRIAPIDHVQCFGVNRKFTMDNIKLPREPLTKELTLAKLRCVDEFLVTLPLLEKQKAIEQAKGLLDNALATLSNSDLLLPEEWQAREYVENVIALLSDAKRNDKVIEGFKNLLLL